MARWLSWMVGLVLITILYVVVVNAHFYAPDPVGSARLLAMQIEAPAGCRAQAMRDLSRMRANGSAMFAAPVVEDADGALVVRQDSEGECAVGEGDRPLAVADVAKIRPETPVLFRFKEGDAALAERFLAELDQAGRDLVAARDAVLGPPALIARLREAKPGVWAMTADEIAACAGDYRRTGWTGLTLPESCRDRTLVVPVGERWLFWGWPDRLIARMDSLDARIMVTDGVSADRPLGTGLTEIERLGSIPRSYNGWLLVDSGETFGRSIRR